AHRRDRGPAFARAAAHLAVLLARFRRHPFAGCRRAQLFAVRARLHPRADRIGVSGRDGPGAGNPRLLQGSLRLGSNSAWAAGAATGRCSLPRKWARKLVGKSVMMPSTPSLASRSASLRSLTVQVETLSPRRRALRISRGETSLWWGISQRQPSAAARR